MPSTDRHVYALLAAAVAGLLIVVWLVRPSGGFCASSRQQPGSIVAVLNCPPAAAYGD